MQILPFFSQHDSIDCGPTCLKMIAKYYGKEYALEYLRDLCFINKEGVSLLNINDAAESLGFRTMMAYLHLDQLTNDSPLPCILHWNQNHFVVLYKIKNKFVIGDPAHGIIKVDKNTFLSSWISTSADKGTVLLLEPTTNFYLNKDKKENKTRFSFLIQYLKPFRNYIFQIFLGMLATSFISLLFPFLTQLLIDEGVENKNKSIIILVLLSQLLLFIGNMVIDIIRGWLILHINTRISLNIISDFLIKLLKLPIKFFDTKAVGDISQRINDYHRIESFLSGNMLSSIFSILNILVFSIIIAFYNWIIFWVFIIASIIGIIWILLFQKKRKELDYKRFSSNRENQDKLYEMITGMQEIKLYGSETPKRLEWERIQVRYFNLNIKSLTLEQFQQSGFIFFTTLKNIIISFIAANEAVDGSISLGMLLSISYIIGQTNGPIEQLISFIKSAQDARLSMDRLQEIHEKEEEDNSSSKNPNSQIINHDEIKIKNVAYQYGGPKSPFVLRNICVTIPKGKITAIVGTSGSGKSTLMKLLLGFYSPIEGEILIGNKNLKHISPKLWRQEYGTVMQDGYIFFDTIAKNIALDGKEINDFRMQQAVKIANIKDFIESLPLGYTTKIGASGIGISGGERQRILMARAIYKNPNYLFFDEATSSLDATNENIIMSNLSRFFEGRTVIIIAHRLSTVKNADQIIVLEDGNIAEIGTHDTLTKLKGKYFELVKNQLELGQ
ncbi:peptidase domain-containing ABC transporter [Rhizosphaericola mali]|uniref:Peptidase domain-containing ABC transporter n=1 Tax=Rhizosphaericola mali TaxID=2545455 RepID=A0A5P2GD00_9BACT|nr:peptidase domain-containing ABC transporter [Rhizosphaericola mali]QES91063.1 peptidase domain-containing ABC transporter [Rhizosphaericola mali]